MHYALNYILLYYNSENYTLREEYNKNHILNDLEF